MMKYNLFIIAVVLSTMSLALVGCGSSSSTSQSSPSIIYADALGDHWEDWSWDTRRNLISTEIVHSGESAIAIDYAEKGWGGLAFGRHSPIRMKGYDRLEFWIHGGDSGGQLLRVSFNTCVGDCELPPGGISINNSKYIAGGAVSANSWKLVKIPLSDLDAVDVSIIKVNLMNNRGGAQPSFYVDDIVFVEK